MLNPVRWLGATQMFVRMLLKLAMVGKNKAAPANVQHAPAVLEHGARAQCDVRPGDKVMWGYWHSGRATMPGYCEFCVRTWLARNPGWKVVVLDEDMLSSYLDPSDLPSTFGSLKVQHRSDIVRVAVLRRFGGIYMDVSTFCLQGFERIFTMRGGPNLLLSGPTDGAFTADAAAHFPNNALLIARRPGDPILGEWHRRVLAYAEHPCGTIDEMEKDPGFARVRPFLRDPGLGVLKPSVTYLAYLFLLMDLLAYDDAWTDRVASGVGLLPTGSWTFDFFVLLDAPADGVFAWHFAGFLRRIVGWLAVRWGDDEGRARAICQRVSVVKSSSDGNVEMHKPANWFVHPSRRSTLARVWRAAADPHSGQPQASLDGMQPWPRGRLK